MKQMISTLSPTLLVLLLLSGCTGHVNAPGSQLTDVSTSRNQRTASGETLLQCTDDGDSDPALADGCLQSWRKAVKGDEKGAMSQLQALSQRYPRAITVKFMMGQVEDHAGKKQEAVKYYREAVKQSSFNSMYLFKLAESLRTAGNAKEAIADYRELIESNPQFVPGRVGLAQCLFAVDKNSKEAREQVERALDLDPDDKGAQALSKEMGSENKKS